MKLSPTTREMMAIRNAPFPLMVEVHPLMLLRIFVAVKRASESGLLSGNILKAAVEFGEKAANGYPQHVRDLLMSGVDPTELTSLID